MLMPFNSDHLGVTYAAASASDTTLIFAMPYSRHGARVGYHLPWDTFYIHERIERVRSRCSAPRAELLDISISSQLGPCIITALRERLSGGINGRGGRICSTSKITAPALSTEHLPLLIPTRLISAYLSQIIISICELSFVIEAPCESVHVPD